MKKKYGDLASGIFIMLLALALFLASTKIKTLDISTFGSGFFPAIVAGLLAILGLVITIGGIKKVKEGGAPAGGAAKAEEDRTRPWGVLATFGLMALYAGLLPKIGFILMTIVYLFLQMLILAPRHKRNFLLFGLISAISSVSVYYTFVKVFQLMLPAGILG